MSARHSLCWALVVCNGQAPRRALLRSLAARAAIVVAADGGANVCRTYGVAPDVIIGDLDSVTSETLKDSGGSLLVRVKRQDNTDLEKALDFLAGNGVREAVILGADGRRIDFTLGNLSVLWRYYGRLSLTVAGDGWYAVPVRGRMSLTAPAGTVVSVIPNGRVAGLTLRGFRYPLRDAVMRIGEIGVSNVVRSRPASVTVRSGSLLVIVQRAWTPDASPGR
jgi:thiamine pyrophosphokinase